jgi:hypothetical protein
VSTETIYRSLFVQARGVLGKELTAHLRTRRTMRRSRHATTRGQGRAGITDAISIRERPAEAADRAVPGHWEGDLLAGAANTHMATLVERQSRYGMLVKVDGKDTKTVVDALATHVQTLAVQLRASLTWDRGMELAEHKRFTVATDVAVYFCDPRSPGSGAPTRTPTACSASTSPSKPISRSSPRSTSTPSPRGSTPGHARPLSTRPLLLGSRRSLHRPIERAGITFTRQRPLLSQVALWS